MRGESLSIVMLAYDEADNVGAVLDELCTWLRSRELDAEIIVVDDGSRDDTAAAAERALTGWPRAKVVRHASNRGMGAGLKTGTRAAGGTWVTFLPADGQIAPEAIGTLLDARDDADVVLSVYADRDDGWVRTVLSAGVRTLITIVHGVRVHSDGPYLFRRSLLDERQLPPDTFFLNFEFPIRALASGLRVRTVTIECRARLSGESKSARPGRVLGVAKDLLELRTRRVRDAWRRML